MAKPIHTSKQGTATNSKEDATTKTPTTHTPNKQAILTLHNPLHHNKPMEGGSNRGATKVGMVRLRRQIQAVQVRLAVDTVRLMLRTMLGRELIVFSWRK